MKGETKNITIEFDPALVKGGYPTLLVEQYNSRNPNAQVVQGSLYSPDSTIQLTLSSKNNRVYYQVNSQKPTGSGAICTGACY